jgi:hypothetical protein
MTESQAAGPKTELIGVSARMQQSIEDLIASLTEGVGDCLQNARGAVPRSDFDDSRSRERRDAVQIASTAAEVLASIAKLKGGFSHDYRITRLNAAEKPPARAPGPYWNGDSDQLLTQKEYDALSEYEQVDYQRWVDGYPPKCGGWRRPERIATPSPSQNHGSNAEPAETQENGVSNAADAG